MTWEENIKAIRELWPDAVWNDTLRSLFMKELEPLQQDALADAIRLVKKTYTSQQPEVKWVLQAYSEVQNAKRLAERKPLQPAPKHVIADTDETQEQRLFREWASVIESASKAELGSFNEPIVAAMESARLSAKTAFILLSQIRKRLDNAA